MALHLIVDRRSKGSKNVVNRNRFLDRVREYVQDGLEKRLREGGIEDIDKGMDISVRKRDLAQPEFHHGRGGVHDIVHPGNREFIRGTKIPKPKGGSGSGGNGAGDGDGEDDFVFQLTPEEVQQIFFDDMGLPNMRDTSVTEVKGIERARAGFTVDGTALDLRRSVLNKKMRTRGLRQRMHDQLEQLEEELRRLQAETPDPETEAEIKGLLAHIAKLKRGPRFDPSDLRYKHYENRPKLIARAVMICMMDVSGSMDEDRKDLAKRFYILLYLFLTSKYEHVELVFIRHTNDAEEVDQQTFFYDAKSGGTTVLSAVTLARKIIDARYPSDDWNIYIAQASDGDAFHGDGDETAAFIRSDLLPLVRYMTYIEVGNDAGTVSSLMRAYVAAHFPPEQFGMRSVREKEDVFPALHGLFQKGEIE